MCSELGQKLCTNLRESSVLKKLCTNQIKIWWYPFERCFHYKRFIHGESKSFNMETKDDNHYWSSFKRACSSFIRSNIYLGIYLLVWCLIAYLPLKFFFCEWFLFIDTWKHIEWEPRDYVLLPTNYCIFFNSVMHPRNWTRIQLIIAYFII